jgi:hypothetical protein
MNPERDFVKYFYETYKGRVLIGVGYDQNLSEIFPFVFEGDDGESIGVIALGVIQHDNVNYVHIYHLGAFKSKRGNGSKMLRGLCCQADKYQIILSLSPIFIPDNENKPMNDGELRSWYERFGFAGNSPFKREPRKN